MYTIQRHLVVQRLDTCSAAHYRKSVFSIFTVTPLKIKMQPFHTERPKSRKWKKLNVIKASTRIKSARYFVREIFGQNALCGDPIRRHIGVPLRGTNMAAGNQQKYLSLSFSLEDLIRIKVEGKSEKELVRQLGELYASLKGNKQNMYNLNLWVKSIAKMHDSKGRTVAFTL